MTRKDITDTIGELVEDNIEPRHTRGVAHDPLVETLVESRVDLDWGDSFIAGNGVRKPHKQADIKNKEQFDEIAGKIRRKMGEPDDFEGVDEKVSWINAKEIRSNSDDGWTWEGTSGDYAYIANNPPVVGGTTDILRELNLLPRKDGGPTEHLEESYSDTAYRHKCPFTGTMVREKEQGGRFMTNPKNAICIKWSGEHWSDRQKSVEPHDRVDHETGIMRIYTDVKNPEAKSKRERNKIINGKYGKAWDIEVEICPIKKTGQ